MAIKETPEKNEPLVENQLPDIDRKDYANDPSTTNRAHQIKRSDDNVKNISVTLQDIDEAILYYFNNVILPFNYDYDNTSRERIHICICYIIL